MTLGVLGIILSLIFLIVAAYRGMSVIIAAPLAALVALIFAGMPLLPGYTEIFMTGAAGFIINYFPLFLAGAVFGQLMRVSGFAEGIAHTIVRILGPKRAILGTVLICSILAYGGVSVFVVVFVMFPLALELFRAADIPRRLIPATISLGAFTFVMTALPGSPQIQNVIPGKFLGTNTFAAPVIGIISGALMFTLGMLYLEWRKKKMIAAGENFATITDMEQRQAKKGSTRSVRVDAAGEQHASDGVVDPDTATDERSGSTAASLRTATGEPTEHQIRLLPFLPIVAVFVVNILATYVVLPAMDWSMLGEELYGGISLQDRISTWAVLLALLAAILVVLLANIGRLGELFQAFAQGARDSLMPIFNTASEVGYGTVIGSVAAFAVVREAVTGLSSNALLNSAVAVSALAGITGSASGGMTIALNTLGDDLILQAENQGLAMETMHRIIAMGSGGLDTMPHNGAIISLLIICNLTHRDSYKDIFVITLAITSAVTLLMIAILSIFG